jgi:hypothetical protein
VESIREFVPGDKDFVAFFTSDCICVPLVPAGEPFPIDTDSPFTPMDTVETPSTSNTIQATTPSHIISPFGSPTAVAAKHMSAEMIVNEPVDINKSSYLAKKGKGQNGYTWKKRYFALRNGLMDCLEKV